MSRQFSKGLASFIGPTGGRRWSAAGQYDGQMHAHSSTDGTIGADNVGIPFDGGVLGQEAMSARAAADFLGRPGGTSTIRAVPLLHVSGDPGQRLVMAGHARVIVQDVDHVAVECFVGNVWTEGADEGEFTLVNKGDAIRQCPCRGGSSKGSGTPCQRGREASESQRFADACGPARQGPGGNVSKLSGPGSGNPLCTGTPFGGIQRQGTSNLQQYTHRRFAARIEHHLRPRC